MTKISAYAKNATITLLKRTDTKSSGHSNYESVYDIDVFLEKASELTDDMPNMRYANSYKVVIQKDAGDIDPAIHRVEYNGKRYIIESISSSGYGSIKVYELLIREVVND